MGSSIAVWDLCQIPYCFFGFEVISNQVSAQEDDGSTPLQGRQTSPAEGTSTPANAMELYDTQGTNCT